jgi:cyclic pyranopterin phosphate synthase
MVDVAGKPHTTRTAMAVGAIRMSAEAFAQVREGSGPKGDILSTAELAGTMAAKRTAELIPLCHPLSLAHVRVAAALDDELPGIRIEAEAKHVGQTGVEMEALTAVSVALLTVYDMVKATGHGMTIEGIELAEKSGGSSGKWTREREDTA